jgi:hypothetical protein
MAMLPAYQINADPFASSMSGFGDAVGNALLAYRKRQKEDEQRMGLVESLARTPGVGLTQAESLAKNPDVARNVLAQYMNPMLPLQKNQMEQQMALARSAEGRAAAMHPFQIQNLQAQIGSTNMSTALHGQQLDTARQTAPYDVTLKRLSAANAQREFDTPKPNTFDLAEGHTRYEQLRGPDGAPLRNPDGTVAVKKVAEGGAKISATAQKAIDEADDFVKQSGNAIGAIKHAIGLNSLAYSGVGAGVRSAIVNNIPLLNGTRASLATTELDNLITNQALSALRSTFGGNPTEGERKILLEVQGSVGLPAEARARILQRALTAAEQSQRFNLQKGDALRSGTYYQPGGMPRSAVDVAAPPTRYRARNPQTGQQIESDDGVNWRPVGGN